MHFYFYCFVSKVNKSKFFQMMQEIQKISSLTEWKFSYLIMLTLKSKPIIQVATSTKIILCYVQAWLRMNNQYCTWLNWKKLYVWHFNRNFSILFFQICDKDGLLFVPANKKHLKDENWFSKKQDGDSFLPYQDYSTLKQSHSD